MNHDELLAELDELDRSCSVVGIAVSALRAVVEWHRESYNPNIMDNRSVCQQCTTGLENIVHYPCPTIRIIEKELG